MTICATIYRPTGLSSTVSIEISAAKKANEEKENGALNIFYKHRQSSAEK